MRFSLAGGDDAELDARIASLTAALPVGNRGDRQPRDRLQPPRDAADAGGAADAVRPA